LSNEQLKSFESMACANPSPSEPSIALFQEIVQLDLLHFRFLLPMISVHFLSQKHAGGARPRADGVPHEGMRARAGMEIGKGNRKEQKKENKAH
jgi:hypothetical protein